jgi:hypothetical protein
MIRSSNLVRTAEGGLQLQTLSDREEIQTEALSRYKLLCWMEQIAVYLREDEFDRARL